MRRITRRPRDVFANSQLHFICVIRELVCTNESTWANASFERQISFLCSLALMIHSLYTSQHTLTHKHGRATQTRKLCTCTCISPISSTFFSLIMFMRPDICTVVASWKSDDADEKNDIRKVYYDEAQGQIRTS